MLTNASCFVNDKWCMRKKVRAEVSNNGFDDQNHNVGAYPQPGKETYIYNLLFSIVQKENSKPT
jgi:hypothetical protein